MFRMFLVMVYLDGLLNGAHYNILSAVVCASGMCISRVLTLLQYLCKSDKIFGVT